MPITLTLLAFHLTSRIKFTIFHNRNTLYRACVKIDRAFHALTCISPFHGDFSRSCVFGAMRLSLCSARLWKYFTGVRRSYDAGWAAVWWKYFLGSPWADFECRYAYRYIQISALPDHPWKYPFIYLPWNLKICSWFSEKFTICSWWFSLLHSWGMGFLLMMTAILVVGFLGNGIAFSGKIWYNWNAKQTVGLILRLEICPIKQRFNYEKEHYKCYERILFKN